MSTFESTVRRPRLARPRTRRRAVAVEEARPRARTRRAPFETVAYLAAIALLMTYVVFITGRIASVSSSTGVLLTLGGSLLAGALALPVRMTWGRRDERRRPPT